MSIARIQGLTGKFPTSAYPLLLQAKSTDMSDMKSSNPEVAISHVGVVCCGTSAAQNVILVMTKKGFLAMKMVQ